MVPGSGNTLRVNGRAHISADPDLLASFAVEDKAPRTVAVVEIDAVYFQCSRALLRSDLWNPDTRVDPKALPTPGQILAALTDNRVGGQAYDDAWPQRARESMW
jgi:predicted pyridoxine 5'-phosphate oxidase superfamily flavin-nucleotide-binding protein